MIEWLKQQYNDLLFKMFPVMPSYIAKECYEEFDEKYKEFRIMTENKRFTCENYGLNCLNCPLWNRYSDYCTKFKIWSETND